MRHFRIAAIKIPEPEKINELAESLRYFEVDGKPVRSLRFDTSILAANRDKLNDQTLFVRKLPKSLSAENLHKTIEENKYGGIKSLKVSINKDYSSRGYAFITFDKSDDADGAFKDHLSKLGFEDV